MQTRHNRAYVNIDALNIIATITAISLISTTVYVYAYLEFIGRPDLFIPVLQESISLKLVLSLGLLIGLFAIATLTGPSTFIILVRKYISDERFTTSKTSLLFRAAFLPYMTIFLLFVAIEYTENYDILKSLDFFGFLFAVYFLCYLILFFKEIYFITLNNKPFDNIVFLHF